MDVFNITCGVVTILSFLFGLYQVYQLKRLETKIKNSLQTYAGNLANIQQSTQWAYHNVDDAIKNMTDFQISPQGKKIIKTLSNAKGDAAAADRMIENLFNDIITMQKNQFNSDAVRHPSFNTLPLIKKSLDNGLITIHEGANK